MVPPLRPDDSECCNSGCNPCILDVYEQQLCKFKEFLTNPTVEQPQQRYNCIDEIVLKKFKLIERIQHTTNTYFYRFQYCDNDGDEDHDNDRKPHGLFYKWGQYFLLKSRDENQEFTRAYTPIPYNSDNKYSFTILVRIYADGKMSKYLNDLQINDTTLWRGPYGGEFRLNPAKIWQIFVAQGVGIAPIFAIIKQLLDDENCVQKFKLFYCCRNCCEIQLREELIEFNRYWNFNCEIFISDTSNYSKHYYETIHRNKLEYRDLNRFICDKIDAIQANICGSRLFETTIKQWLLDCGIDECNIYLF